jgi:hypothetical protein
MFPGGVSSSSAGIVESFDMEPVVVGSVTSLKILEGRRRASFHSQPLQHLLKTEA